ncbi:DNA breaking-rejoining enzyme [Auricularia subglabra TFB-10046 SS5]|uniref:DNA breaking-rejoining enzyme n=1 Tax=Auricularia subglabra (strain TFB-10046 / SS5) TaxID=717982 RepID=J0D469_AURST|nr:DNA breaking-rejoining enzyme [Auricularia subglabra TFB-10046 SS5]
MLLAAPPPLPQVPAATSPPPVLLAPRPPRAQRKNSTLCASPFRPHVRAPERFRSWSSAYSVLRDARNAGVLPQGARDTRFSTILSSVEPKTLATYSAGLLRFHEYCDEQNVPESDRMPASDFLLSSFVAHYAGKVSRSCVENWTAGLQLWHNLHDAPWHGARALCAVSKAVAKKVPPTSVRPRRPPVTVEHIRCLRRHLDLSNTCDAAVYAAAVFAFRGCCRLGEVVTPLRAPFDPSRQVSRASPVTFGRNPEGVSYTSIRLPWTKTAGVRGAEVVLTSSADDICPVLALRQHFSVNYDVPEDAPLFAWTAEPGSWKPMTRELLLSRCTEIWAANGLDKVQGHSFRIGGATDLLLRGVPPAVVAMQGRWSSRAFLQYWRNVEVILPTFIARARAGVTMESLGAAVNRMEVELV